MRKRATQRKKNQPPHTPIFPILPIFGVRFLFSFFFSSQTPCRECVTERERERECARGGGGDPQGLGGGPHAVVCAPPRRHPSTTTTPGSALLADPLFGPTAPFLLSLLTAGLASKKTKTNVNTTIAGPRPSAGTRVDVFAFFCVGGGGLERERWREERGPTHDPDQPRALVRRAKETPPRARGINRHGDSDSGGRQAEGERGRESSSSDSGLAARAHAFIISQETLDDPR